MADEWAVFGYGYFGKIHAREIEEHGEVSCIVDPFAGDIPDDVTRVSEFITNRVTVERNADGVPTDHEYDPLPDGNPLTEVDVWDIVTPSSTHFELLIAALEEGKRVFVENPPAETAAEIEYLLEQFDTSEVCVDLIELGHPVLNAVVDAIDEADVSPEYAVHYRTKDLRGDKGGIGSGEGSRVTLGHLIHDVSEIDRYTTAAGIGGVEDGTVSRGSVERWQELDSMRAYGTDVHSEFTITFPDGFSADVRGSYAETERRYFVVTNDSDWAVFGSTLSREFIDPYAAVVQGEENVETLVDKAGSGAITNMAELESVMEEVDASPLTDEIATNVPAAKTDDGNVNVEEAPLHWMISQFNRASCADDIPCTLEDALTYQRVCEEVYRQANDTEALQTPTSRTL